jgi:hypothetical protein
MREKKNNEIKTLQQKAFLFEVFPKDFFFFFHKQLEN